MNDNRHILDEEEDKLFQELGGIDRQDRVVMPSYLPEDYDEGLQEEESRMDGCRILLIELMHLISVYFRDVQYWEGAKGEQEHFNSIVQVIRELSNVAEHDGTVLVRFRGVPTDPKRSAKNDYVILFGDMIFDLDMIPSIVKRQGTRATHLAGRLGKAFDTFSERGINNIHMKVMAENPAVLDRMLVSLRILSRYHKALENDTPIVFEKNRVEVTLPIIKDEQRKSDINLTLVAGLNHLNPKTMESLVQKVDQWMQRSQSSVSWEPHSSVFNVMFSVKSLREKLFEPPIAVNNIRWLMADKSYAAISKEKAQIVRMVMAYYGGTPEETMLILNSIYGNDFEKIRTRQFASRINSATHLLTRIQQQGKDPRYEREVLRNIESRMDVVKDDIYDDLIIQQDTIRIGSNEKETLFEKINSKLMGMVEFYKKRSKTRRKIKNIVTSTIDFDNGDEQGMPLRYILSLEREVHIFVALLKGTTPRSVLRNAIKIYGFPESAVYQLNESRRNISALLNHLKVAIRGLGRVGEARDISLLEEIRGCESGFLSFGKGTVHEELVRRIMEWVDGVRYSLSQK